MQNRTYISPLLSEILIILLVFAGGCETDPTSAPDETPKGEVAFTVQGKLDGGEPARVYLKKYDDDAYALVDSVEVDTSGKFSFSATSPVVQRYYISVKGVPGRPSAFFIDSGDINWRGHRDSLQTAILTGSAPQAEFEKAEASLAEIRETAGRNREASQKAREAGDVQLADSLMEIAREAGSKTEAYVMNFIENKPGSSVAAYLAYRYLMFAEDPDLLAAALENLSEPATRSPYYVKAAEVVATRRRTAAGQPIVDFTQPTVDGDSLSTKSFRGRTLLIDFWASWCGPCRRANPELVEIYNRYHDRGFDILGVSLDEDAEDWRQAILDDQLSWSHVSELRGWQDEAHQLYGVMGIPHQVLVDPEGIILVNGIELDALDSTLNARLAISNSAR